MGLALNLIGVLCKPYLVVDRKLTGGFMVTVVELGKVMVTFDGRPIPDFQGNPMSVRDVLLHYLGTYTSKNGKNIIDAYQLGMKIAKHTEATIQLENAEFLILKESVQNPAHGALIMGQIAEVLDRAEETKVDKK